MFDELIKNTSVIVLCGGLGTRLRPVVPDTPKSLAPVGGRPFLDILLSFLKEQGLRHVILAVGYGGDKIKRHYAANRSFDVVFSEETTPLGTGGAFKKALPLTRSKEVIAVNGDTLCPIRYADLLRFHTENGALASLAITAKNRHDVGGVRIDARGLILDYEERPVAHTHPFMSAGTFVFQRDVRAHLPAQEVFSLERDVLPGLVEMRQCFGYSTSASALDIGTPERYAEAQRSLHTRAEI